MYINILFDSFLSILSILSKIIDFIQKSQLWPPNLLKNSKNRFLGTPPTPLFSGLILTKKSELTRYPLALANIRFWRFLDILFSIIKSLQFPVRSPFYRFFWNFFYRGAMIDYFFMFPIIFFRVYIPHWKVIFDLFCDCFYKILQGHVTWESFLSKKTKFLLFLFWFKSFGSVLKVVNFSIN